MCICLISEHQYRILHPQVGPSEPSEVVTIVTSEEPPAGPPTSVVVSPLDRGLLVSWKPPQEELLNGEVLVSRGPGVMGWIGMKLLQ